MCVAQVEYCAGLSMLLKGSPVEKYQLCFEMYDLDKSGHVSKAEMLQAFRALNTTLSQANSTGASYGDEALAQFVDEVFKHADKDQDQQLTFQEFLEACRAYPSLIEF